MTSLNKIPKGARCFSIIVLLVTAASPAPAITPFEIILTVNPSRFVKRDAHFAFPDLCTGHKTPFKNMTFNQAPIVVYTFFTDASKTSIDELLTELETSAPHLAQFLRAVKIPANRDRLIRQFLTLLDNNEGLIAVLEELDQIQSHQVGESGNEGIALWSFFKWLSVTAFPVISSSQAEMPELPDLIRLLQGLYQHASPQLQAAIITAAETNPQALTLIVNTPALYWLNQLSAGLQLTEEELTDLIHVAAELINQEGSDNLRRDRFLLLLFAQLLEIGLPPLNSGAYLVPDIFHSIQTALEQYASQFGEDLRKNQLIIQALLVMMFQRPDLLRIFLQHTSSLFNTESEMFLAQLNQLASILQQDLFPLIALLMANPGYIQTAVQAFNTAPEPYDFFSALFTASDSIQTLQQALTVFLPSLPAPPAQLDEPEDSESTSGFALSASVEETGVGSISTDMTLLNPFHPPPELATALSQLAERNHQQWVTLRQHRDILNVIGDLIRGVELETSQVEVILSTAADLLSTEGSQDQNYFLLMLLQTMISQQLGPFQQQTISAIQTNHPTIITIFSELLVSYFPELPFDTHEAIAAGIVIMMQNYQDQLQLLHGTNLSIQNAEATAFLPALEQLAVQGSENVQPVLLLLLFHPVLILPLNQLIAENSASAAPLVQFLGSIQVGTMMGVEDWQVQLLALSLPFHVSATPLEQTDPINETLFSLVSDTLNAITENPIADLHSLLVSLHAQVPNLNFIVDRAEVMAALQAFLNNHRAGSGQR